MSKNEYLQLIDNSKYKNYNHDFIIKIHTKTDDNFRNSTLKNLFGTHRILKKNIQKLQNESIGIISGYRIHKFNESTEYFHSNIHYLNIFVKHLYHCNVENDKLEFVHGTFFIAKMKIFEILNLIVLKLLGIHIVVIFVGKYRRHSAIRPLPDKICPCRLRKKLRATIAMM